MELGGHRISIVPVGLPAAPDGESGLNVELHLVFVSLSVGARNVTDVVEIEQIVDVARKRNFQIIDDTLKVLMVVLIEIDTAPFSLDGGSLVVHHEIFVDENVAPVRDFVLLPGLREDGHGASVLEVDHKGIEC